MEISGEFVRFSQFQCFFNTFQHSFNQTFMCNWWKNLAAAAVFSSTTIKSTNSLQEKMQTVCAGKIIRRMYEESKFLIPTECPKFDSGRNGAILSAIANNVLFPVAFAIAAHITQSAALRLLILCDFFQYHVHLLFLSIPDNGQRDSIAGIVFIFIVIQFFCGLNRIIINRCNDVTNL